MRLGLCLLLIPSAWCAGALVFDPPFGGSRSNSATGIALDSHGNIYVVGQTNSADFPLVGACKAIRARRLFPFHRMAARPLRLPDWAQPRYIPSRRRGTAGGDLCRYGWRMYANSISTDPLNSGTVNVIGPSGFDRSPDGGQSWFQFPSPTPGVAAAGPRLFPVRRITYPGYHGAARGIDRDSTGGFRAAAEQRGVNPAGAIGAKLTPATLVEMEPELKRCEVEPGGDTGGGHGGRSAGRPE